MAIQAWLVWETDKELVEMPVFIFTRKRVSSGRWASAMASTTLIESLPLFLDVDQDTLSVQSPFVTTRAFEFPHMPTAAVIVFSSSERWDSQRNPDIAMAVAAHELGHALGLGGSQVFHSLICDRWAVVGPPRKVFMGENSRETLNDVPAVLTKDGVHLSPWVMYETPESLMYPRTSRQMPSAPTLLDIAMFEDISTTEQPHPECTN